MHRPPLHLSNIKSFMISLTCRCSVVRNIEISIFFKTEMSIVSIVCRSFVWPIQHTHKHSVWGRSGGDKFSKATSIKYHTYNQCFFFNFISKSHKPGTTNDMWTQIINALLTLMVLVLCNFKAAAAGQTCTKMWTGQPGWLVPLSRQGSRQYLPQETGPPPCTAGLRWRCGSWRACWPSARCSPTATCC